MNESWHRHFLTLMSNYKTSCFMLSPIGKENFFKPRLTPIFNGSHGEKIFGVSIENCVQGRTCNFREPFSCRVNIGVADKKINGGKIVRSTFKGIDLCISYDF